MKISRDKIRQQALLTGRRTLELGKEAGGRVRRFPAFVRAGTIWIKKADRTNLRPVFSGKRAAEAAI